MHSTSVICAFDRMIHGDINKILLTITII